MALPLKVEINTYFGQCKCCLNYAYLKNMWEQHWTEGERLIYGKMLVDCFSISWTIRERVDDDKMCEICISKLLEAFSFKKQVLLSQSELLREAKVKTQDEIENRVSESSDAEQKAYEDVEFLEEDVLDDGYKQSDKQDEDSQPNTNKRKCPQALTKNKRNKTYKQYTEEQLNKSLEAVKSKKLTIQQAVEAYNVPRKTIAQKIKSLDEKKELVKENLASQKVPEFVKSIQAILTHTNATPFKSKSNRYYCLFCPADSPDIEDPKDLRAHTHSVHKDKVKQVDLVMRPYYNNEMLRLDIENLTCKCNKKASWQEMLDHLKTEHGVALEELSKKVIPYRLTTNDMNCVICDYSATFMSVDSHMNSHYNNYMCGHCGDSFITSTRLKNHIQNHKIGIYPCNICDKMFSRDMYRKKHITAVHERREIFKCFHCDERFSTDTLRLSHMKSNHKDKVEIKARTCKLCNKSFSWGVAYSKHMRRHHSHIENTCSECGKGFENQKLLEEHKLRHSGVKKYECDVCKKPYFSQTAVTMHKKHKHHVKSEDNVIVVENSTSELENYLATFKGGKSEM